MRVVAVIVSYFRISLILQSAYNIAPRVKDLQRKGQIRRLKNVRGKKKKYPLSSSVPYGTHLYTVLTEEEKNLQNLLKLGFR